MIKKGSPVVTVSNASVKQCVDFSSEMMTPTLVLTCDGAYAMSLATTMRSIVDSNRSAWPLDFYLLISEFPKEVQEKLERSLPAQSALIHWLPVDVTQFQDFGVVAAGSYVSRMAYARLLISQVLPDTITRVLYLDTDTLVTDELRLLWEMDLGGAILGAVPDANLNNAIQCGALRIEQVPQVQEYFNAGVLLIDLPLWREKQVSVKAFEYLTTNPNSLYLDQDALNAVCDGAWRKLDVRWNFQDHLNNNLAGMAPARRPAIVHFVTKVKPWDFTMPNVNARFYDEYRSRTCFARTPYERLRDTVNTAWRRLKDIVKKLPFLRSSLGRSRLREPGTKRPIRRRREDEKQCDQYVSNQ